MLQKISSLPMTLQWMVLQTNMYFPVKPALQWNTRLLQHRRHCCHRQRKARKSQLRQRKDQRSQTSKNPFEDLVIWKGIAYLTPVKHLLYCVVLHLHYWNHLQVSIAFVFIETFSQMAMQWCSYEQIKQVPNEQSIIWSSSDSLRGSDISWF